MIATNNISMIKTITIFIALLFSFYSLNAQPGDQSCYSERGIKIILEGSDELILSPTTPLSINNCFFIPKSTIKDSLGITYFKLTIYKNIIDASDDTWKGKKMYTKDSVYTYKVRDVDKMMIYVGNFDRNDHISFELEIPEFKKGTFFIDVKKNDGMKGVYYDEYKNSDGAPSYDITPKEWSEIKKWKN
ncbi:hypothetical protein L1276_003980 [Flavobacterium sp. HSC-32F16]|uniref:hypothetical protein n=1 Tax=Flavobacterium sp. HSC-32F16 TaxID=2910964 RepID=UPI0020A259D7|nr:hypothetical protein [Flavobacterium sp. HSC-32F16]MCP2028809.1 hypothetical protein [Flavobacterium sp. HSC-32F16]